MNNAGVIVYGDVELCSLELYKSVCDINLFGLIRVTKTFLPLVRKAQGLYTIGRKVGRKCFI